jgi:putative ABC transport system permease protein
MFMLLQKISLPEARKHLLRYLVTLLGILLGVAVFSAVRAANASLQTALRSTIDQIAGKAVLQVTSVQGGIPEAALDAVRAVAGVRAAVPVIEAVVRTADASQGNILILGIDMTGDRSMREYTLEGDDDEVADPLVFLAQPDSLIVSKAFADRNQLTEDAPVTLITALGPKMFTVRGIMSPQGMAMAFGGNIGVMDIYSAQFVFERGRFFDRIDIALDASIKIDAALPLLQDTLGPGFKIEPPRRRGQQMESLIEAFSQALVFSSVMALLVGLFLIFNIFSVSVTQRRTQIGILRALGVTRWQVQGLFLGESLVLGLLGSGLGVVAGLFLGRAMMWLMVSVVEEVYGVRAVVDKLYIDLQWAAVSVGLGALTSVVGAYLPARAAAHVDPALALQKGKFQVMFLGENWHRAWAGGLLLAICLGLGYTPWSAMLSIQLPMQAGLFMGLTLLVPTFSHGLAVVLRRPMGWLFGIQGRLASDSLVRAPRRTSATVAALMFSLVFVISSASLSASVKTSLMRWVESAIRPDLFVSATADLIGRPFHFPEAMGEALKKIPGVRQVDAFRMIIVDYQSSTPLLLSIDMQPYLNQSTPLMEQGRVEDLLPGMQGKPGMLISSNLARRHRLRKGDRIVLDTPTGPQAFEVIGVQVDYHSANGSMLLDRQVYKQFWHDNRVDTFDVILEPGVDPHMVRREIQRRFADERNVFVLTNREMRGELLRITGQFWTLTYVQVLVASLVAVLGILNSLMISITERQREIGILRALGGERHQVRQAVLLEAVCVGCVAAILGTAAGSTMGYYMVGMAGTSITGWVFPYQFPAGVALALFPGVLAISLLAAWYPSSLALKTPLVDALAYE